MPRRPKPLSNLADWLGTSQTPLFLLDSEARIRVFNRGCQELTGWTASDVVGEVCHFATAARATGSASLAVSIAPPPEVLKGNHLTLPAQIACASGEIIPRLIHFTPLLGDSGSVTGILGSVAEAGDSPSLEMLSPVHKLHAELLAVRAVLKHRFTRIPLVAVGLPMRRVLAQIELAAQTGTCALFLGEAGTGREHLARVIHEGGPGRAQWFLPLDCRRMPPEELTRILSRLIEEYHSPERTKGSSGPGPGTLYLAAVEELPRDLQQQLIMPIVANRTPATTTSLRVLAGSTLSWDQLRTSGRLRSDLLSAISPLIIELPPLRERPEDLPLLAQTFLEELNLRQSPQRSGFAPSALTRLATWPWPGNLDELYDVVRQAHASALHPAIHASDLPAALQTREGRHPSPPHSLPDLNLNQILRDAERRIITAALRRARFNKSHAAHLLGLHRSKLLRRMEQLGLSESEAVSADPVEKSDAELSSVNSATDHSDKAPGESRRNSEQVPDATDRSATTDLSSQSTQSHTDHTRMVGDVPHEGNESGPPV